MLFVVWAPPQSKILATPMTGKNPNQNLIDDDDDNVKTLMQHLTRPFIYINA